MPCPKCGSHNLWDDWMNGYWGCNDCSSFNSPQKSNNLHPDDKFNEEPKPYKGGDLSEGATYKGNRDDRL